MNAPKSQSISIEGLAEEIVKVIWEDAEERMSLGIQRYDKAIADHFKQTWTTKVSRVIEKRRHGIGGYTRGCRCLICTMSKREYNIVYNREKKERDDRS